MKKLLNCPFCGGEAKYSDNELEHYGLDVPGVECVECYTRNFANTKDEAIEAWNGRTDHRPIVGKSTP